MAVIRNLATHSVMDAGRLYKSKYLRKKGEVRYNGHSRREFNMARTIAMVDQIDQHIASLTVRETLEFAHICQVSLSGTCKLVPSTGSYMQAYKSWPHAGVAESLAAVGCQACKNCLCHHQKGMG